MAVSLPMVAGQFSEAVYQAKWIKGWYQDSKKCYSYMLGGEPDGSCCQSVCPFTKYDEAGKHDLVKLSIAKALIFNGLIRKMDDACFYGVSYDIDRCCPGAIGPVSFNGSKLGPDFFFR